jgi:hypothetical protein
MRMTTEESLRIGHNVDIPLHPHYASEMVQFLVFIASGLSPDTRFRRPILLALFLLPWAGNGCRRNPPEERDDGRFVVVFTNKSDFLVQALLVVQADPYTNRTWAVGIAPQSWDSLVLDCNVERVVPVGALVFTTLGSPEPLELSFDEPPFERGVDFDCNSVLAFQIEPAARNTPTRPITARIRSVYHARSSAMTAQLEPGGNTGFVLIQATAPPDVPVQMNITWEGEDTRIFRTVMTLGGKETLYGFLINCPVRRFALGDLNDSETAGGTLVDSGDPLAPPAPLLDEISCGSAVLIELSNPSGSQNEWSLSLRTTGAPANPSNEMYVELRKLLEAEGLSDNPSSFLSVLPPPALPGQPTGP